MTALIALGSIAAYLTGWAVCARVLFCRWRPSRVPLCGEDSDRYHYHTHSSGSCYRRRKADGRQVQIDSDGWALWWAALASLVWFMAAVPFLMMRNPPQTADELRARIAELEHETGMKS